MMGTALGLLARGVLVGVVTSACYAGVGSAPAPVRGQMADEAGMDSSIDTSSWRGARPRTLAELMDGRFAGVDVFSVPGGGISVRIRGASSLVLGTEPLYVLDGLPVMAGPNGALEDLAPEEVERIEVLRGSAATAAWGSRGANGVILITTRRR